MSDSTRIIAEVKAKYGSVAASSLSNDHAGVKAVAEAFGYSPEELAALPADANMGLSCGNPTATANLRPGEVVVDLGCGGGIDVLIAARKVGPTGKAIGIDMTPEMIARAERNAAQLRAKGEVIQAEFHLASMEAIPLPDATVDCIISNCVINLAPDKPAVFREMFRVLKPGGRVAVSDIALKQELPDELATSVAAYVGCIAGAIPISAYETMLRDAGFLAVQVVDTRKDLNAYAKVENQSVCCSPTMKAPFEEDLLPLATAKASNSASDSSCCDAPTNSVHAELAELVRRYDVNEYAASVQVFAIKPDR